MLAPLAEDLSLPAEARGRTELLHAAPSAWSPGERCVACRASHPWECGPSLRGAGEEPGL